jgi:hypothetical protein
MKSKNDFTCRPRERLSGLTKALALFSDHIKVYSQRKQNKDGEQQNIKRRRKKERPDSLKHAERNRKLRADTSYIPQPAWIGVRVIASSCHCKLLPGAFLYLYDELGANVPGRSSEAHFTYKIMKIRK